MNVFSVQIKTKRARPFRFTLIELLVVVAIMGVIIAVGLPAFEKLTIGSGVDAAVRQVSAQLRLARQYAISNRCKVAVIMPTQEVAGNARWACFRPAVVSGTTPFKFVRWVDGTTWTFLPVGSSIMEADDDVGIQSGGSYTVLGDDAYQKVGVASNEVNLDKLGGSTTAKNVRAVVFSSTGRLAGMSTSLYVTVGEAINNGTVGSAGTWIIRNPANAAKNKSASNQLTITINPYTGRTVTSDPSEY